MTNRFLKLNALSTYLTLGNDLFDAIAARDLDTVHELVQQGHDVNSADHTKMTPLDVAIYWESVPIVRYLLERGANIRRDTLYTVLGQQNLELIKLIVQAGANVNDRYISGNTPLLYFIKHVMRGTYPSAEQMKIMDQLLLAGADSTIPDRGGQTPREWFRLRNLIF